MIIDYQIITDNPVHSKELIPIAEPQIAQLKESIAQLPKILGNIDNWVLSGGIAIPLTAGQFYRVHNDIDIGTPLEKIEELADNALESRYGLFSRIFMTKEGKGRKLDVYKSITPQEAKSGRFKNIRLVRLDRRGKIVRHEALLDYFDIYLHKTEGTEIVSLEDGLRFPVEYAFGNEILLQKNPELKIKLRDLRYVKKVKETTKKRREEPIGKRDLEVIAEFLKK